MLPLDLVDRHGQGLPALVIQFQCHRRLIARFEDTGVVEVQYTGPM
jgi:hypothetical protein